MRNGKFSFFLAMHMTHENIAVLVKKEGLAQIYVIQDHEFH